MSPNPKKKLKPKAAKTPRISHQDMFSPLSVRSRQKPQIPPVFGKQKKVVNKPVKKEKPFEIDDLLKSLRSP